MDLGRRVGVTYFTISEWELEADAEPLPANLAALAKLGGAFRILAEERQALAASSRGQGRLIADLEELGETVARLANVLTLLVEAQRPALRDRLRRVLAGESP